MKTFRQYLSEQQDQYDKTIIKLVDLYKNTFKYNEKTIQQLKESLTNAENQDEINEIKTSIKQEYNRIESIINKAESIKTNSLNEKLMNVTKWIANNGVDPETNFAGNAEYRWKSMLRKIGK